jgi:hypothetical protein
MCPRSPASYRRIAPYRKERSGSFAGAASASVTGAPNLKSPAGIRPFPRPRRGTAGTRWTCLCPSRHVQRAADSACAVAQHVGVDHRRRYVAMAEQLCGGGGPSASSPLLNDEPASLRRGDSHRVRRRSQITRAFNLDTTLVRVFVGGSMTASAVSPVNRQPPTELSTASPRPP